MWTPISPLWIESGEESHLVAIAELNENYRCYHIELPYVDPQPRSIAKASVTHQEPLERELERMRLGQKAGQSVRSDISILLADWMGFLACPSYEEALIEYIATVSALSTDLPAKTQQIIDQIKKISQLLGEPQVAREPIFGGICGTEYSPVELAKFQLPQSSRALATLNHCKNVQDYTLKFKLGSRLQNQPWRAIAYLRDSKRRLTQSDIVDFNAESYASFSVCFKHVYASQDIFFVLEISARELNNSYTRLASGILRFPIHEAQMTMHTPYKGQWSGFVEQLIESTAESDRCRLITATYVTEITSEVQTRVPSLMKDGFNTYSTLHLEIGEFHADSQANSPYFLRLKCQGQGNIDQETSSALLSGSNSNQCFSISDFTYGEVVKAELWRDKSLVSIAAVPYEKLCFVLNFNSLTTFQSIGLTKNLAAIRCNATFMGQTRRLESIELIETYFEHTDIEVLSAIRDMPINKQVFERFSSVGTALLSLIGHFNENPHIHEAAFSALLALLDIGKEYPHIMRRLLDHSSLTHTGKHNVLGVFFRQIFNTLSSGKDVRRLVCQSSSIRDLIFQLAPDQTDSIHASEFSVRKEAVPAIQPPTLRVSHNSRNPFKILDELKSPTMEKNDFSWRAMPIIDQIREIVQAMGQAYNSASYETRLAILLNLETFFEGLHRILGESAVLLLFTLLSAIGWDNLYPEVNTEKLFILTRIPSNWRLEKANGTLYANLCINSVAPVWVGKKNSRRWIDVHATTCILQCLLDNIDLTSMGNILSEFLPLTFDISSDLAVLGPQEFNQNFDELFSTRSKHVTSETIALECMLLVQQLLILDSDTVVSSLSVLGQSHLKQIILKAENTCQFWLRFPLLRHEWYSLRLLQLNTICASLEYISQILTSYFSPSPDANILFDADIWYRFFTLLSEFIVNSDLESPKRPIIASAHLKLVGGTVERATSLLKKSWQCLQWKHPLSERKSPLYGYQVSLVCCHQNVTSSFVELVFAGHEAIGPILNQIVGTEYMLNGNLDEITTEILVSIDDLFIKKAKETGKIPLASQCAQFIDIFDYEETYFSGFVETLETYLKLLCDNYRYDSLLSVYRILRFLKLKKLTKLFTRYIGFILKTEKNPRVLGLAFMELASIYDWSDNRIISSLEHPPFSQQRACDRKENLLVMASQCFMNGNHWLLAIDATRECYSYYELNLDYRKLSLMSSRLAQFYERMTVEKHVLPNYYYVEFGEGCAGLEGEKFIFEQPPSIRLKAFTDQIRNKYTEGEIIIETVDPLSAHVYSDNSIMPWLEESLKTNNVKKFVNLTPMPHKDIRDMRVQKVIYTTEQSLPSVSGLSSVIEITRKELSPKENAVEVLRTRSRELRMICSRHSDLDPEMKTSVYLELLLGSTLSSPINGGLTAYKELIGRDSRDELRQVFHELRESTRIALDLYSKLTDEALQPQYEHFMAMFRVNFDLAMPGMQVRVGE